ncbi:MAG: DUF6962 family protein [Sphingomonadales bacterium]
MIGQDYPKIEWQFAGLDLLEPNALIGDLILFSTSLFLAAKIKTNYPQNDFYSNWRRFYLVFGWSFLFGGFGHLLYNYLGLWGKYPSWLLGMVATYFLTKGILSLWPNVKQKVIFEKSALLLLGIGFTLELLVIWRVDLSFDQSKGLFIPTLISGIGLIFSLVIVGIRYQRQIHSGYRFLWIAALLLLPSGLIQNKKINLHQWFDRNDFSHVLLLISLVLYFIALQKTKEANSILDKES